MPRICLSEVRKSVSRCESDFDFLGLFPHDLGETEIQDLELAPFGDHDVAGFEIAVGDPALVGRADGVGDRDREIEESFGIQPLRRDDLSQGGALDVLHAEERNAIRFLDSVDGDDIGVIEGGHRLGLAPESLESIRVRGHLGGENLDRDISIELGVAGQPDLTHPAFAELAEDLVVEQRAADHLCPPLRIADRASGTGFHPLDQFFVARVVADGVEIRILAHPFGVGEPLLVRLVEGVQRGVTCPATE